MSIEPPPALTSTLQNKSQDQDWTTLFYPTREQNCIGRAVHWLKRCEKNSTAAKVVAYIIFLITSIVLCASIVGLPVFIVGYKEYGTQTAEAVALETFNRLKEFYRAFKIAYQQHLDLTIHTQAELQKEIFDLHTQIQVLSQQTQRLQEDALEQLNLQQMQLLLNKLLESMNRLQPLTLNFQQNIIVAQMK